MVVIHHYFRWGPNRVAGPCLKLGIPMPEGYENIHTVEGLVQALADLKKQKPLLRKAVIKMNDGFPAMAMPFFVHGYRSRGCGYRF